MRAVATWLSELQMDEGTDIRDALSGKQFMIVETEGAHSYGHGPITYQRGTQMTFTSTFTGRVIAFTLSLLLSSSAAGTGTLKTRVEGDVESAYTSKDITITESGDKVGAPEIWWVGGTDGIGYRVPDGASAIKFVISNGQEFYMQDSQYNFFYPDFRRFITEEGDFEITAYAADIQSRYTYDGSASATLRFTAIRTERPVITQKENRIEWTDTAGFNNLRETKYTLYKDGVAIASTDDNYYAGTSWNGRYKVETNWSIDEDQSGAILREGRIVYRMPTESDTFALGAVARATVYVMGTKAVFQAYSNNWDTFRFYRDGELAIETKERGLDLAESEPGRHVYELSCVYGKNEGVKSAPASAVWGRMPQPVAYVSGNRYLHVEGGYQYPITIEVNGEGYAYDGSPMDISHILRTGDNQISVRAMPKGLNVPSYPSDPVSVTIRGTAWVADIDGTEYAVQLPISVTRTCDGTLDTGNITLSIDQTKDMKEPFEAYKSIVLKNYADDGTERLRWRFLIESDKVSGKAYGSRIEYLHEITLIEETRKLQAIIMPDMSITQPLSVAGRVGRESEAERFGFRETLGIWPIEYASMERPMTTAWAVGYTGISSISNPLPAEMEVGYEGLLPDWNCEGIQVYGAIVSEDIFSGGITKKQSKRAAIRTYHPRKVVAIRKRTGARWTRAEAIQHIREGTGFVSMQTTTDPIAKLTYRFSESAEYDVYLYAEPIFDRRIREGDPESTFQFNRGAPGLDYDPNVIGMVDREIAVDPSGSFYERIESLATPTADSEFLYCFPVTTKQAEPSDAITIGRAIEKVIGAIRPAVVENGSMEEPEYEWECPHAGEICKEAMWTGGKTLYEILSDIARQFRGVPRLDGRKITFDIIGESLNGNTHYYDERSKENESSDMDTQATTLVTQAKNTFSNDSYEEYPGNGRWITCRANESDEYVTKATSVIKLPRKIYQIKALYVRTADGRTFSLFDKYIKEKTFWNLLPEDVSGKGKCLFYTKGGDSIENIGELAESDLYEILGFSSDRYVIQTIMAEVAGGNPADYDPLDLQYRVVYRPYVDHTVSVEQPNGAESVRSQLAYNQDASECCDERLGQAMEDKVSRLGNNTIEKMQRTDLDSCATLGQKLIRYGRPYYVDKCNYLVERTYVECTMRMSRDRAKIDVDVGLPSEYRQYEIHTEGFARRQLSIDQYVVASAEKFDVSDRFQKSSNYGTADAIEHMLNSEPLKRPDSFYVTSNSLSLMNYPHIQRGWYSELRYGTQVLMTGFALHADCRITGCQVSFHAEALDNYSMGINAYELEAPIGAMTSGRYVQRDCRYVDDLGRAGAFGVTLGRIENESLLSIGHEVARTIPAARYTREPIGMMSSVLVNTAFACDKDSREAMSFQLSVHFVSRGEGVEVRDGFSRNLFERESVIPEIACYRTRGDVGESLRPDQREEIEWHFERSSDSRFEIWTDETEWCLCINDGKVRPLIVVKGHDSVYVTVTDEL